MFTLGHSLAHRPAKEGSQMKLKRNKPKKSKVVFSVMYGGKC